MKSVQLSSLIIFENEELVVCHKPAGMAVQSARVGQMDLESLLRNYYYEKSGNAYLGLIHRLDQPVEGIVVFARTKDGAAELSRQLQDGRMKKEYLALVHSGLQDMPLRQPILLQDALLKAQGQNSSSIVPEGTKGAKRARLTYIPIAGEEEKLLHILLETGRHHQIRVQLSHAGLPLLGDRKYGSAEEDGLLALCAFRLTLFDPATKKERSFCIIPENPRFHPYREKICGWME